MVDMKIPEEVKDRLALLFLMQENLNDFTFDTQKITDSKGEQLKCQTFRVEQIDTALAGKQLGANSNTAIWLRHYQEALLREGDETMEEIPWKWWSKGVITPHLIEEIIDQWHFLISVSIVAGLNHQTLLEAYKQKYTKNVERQNTSYVANGDVAPKDIDTNTYVGDPTPEQTTYVGDSAPGLETTTDASV